MLRLTLFLPSAVESVLRMCEMFTFFVSERHAVMVCNLFISLKTQYYNLVIKVRIRPKLISLGFVYFQKALTNITDLADLAAPLSKHGGNRNDDVS